jgi:hypothetical protein
LSLLDFDHRNHVCALFIFSTNHFLM